MSAGRTLFVVRDGPPSLEAALLDGILAAPGAAAQALVCLLRPQAPWPAISGAQVIAIPAPPRRRALPPGTTVRGVADLALSSGVTLIHSIGAAAQVIGGRAARRARLPSAWSQLGVASWSDGVHLSASLAPAGAVLTYTEAGEHAQRRLPRGRKVRRLAPGVVLPGGSRAERRNVARGKLGLGSDVFAATLAAPAESDAASVQRFLRAGASLCHARSHARLVVAPASTGAALDALQQLTASLGLQGRVIQAPAAPTAVDAADVAVFDAHPNTLPLGLLQAMAAGAAAVATDTPLVREFVVDRADALLVPRHDHESLALALLALADDPEGREALATAGDALVRDRHDGALLAKEISDLHAGLVA